MATDKDDRDALREIEDDEGLTARVVPASRDEPARVRLCCPDEIEMANLTPGQAAAFGRRLIALARQAEA